jgi:hypothetical protein
MASLQVWANESNGQAKGKSNLNAQTLISLLDPHDESHRQLAPGQRYSIENDAIGGRNSHAGSRGSGYL